MKTVYQKLRTVGDKSGEQFECSRIEEGALVDSIEAWVGKAKISGIKVHFTDGEEQMIGVKGSYRGRVIINYAKGDHVKSLKLFRNIRGDRLGGIVIETNKGNFSAIRKKRDGLKNRKFNKMEEIKLEEEELGSGFIVGVKGTLSPGGNMINSISFMMLRTVTESDIVEISYDFQEENLSPPVLVSAHESEQDNTTEVPSLLNKSVIEHSETKEGSWTVSAGLTIGNSFEVSGGVPGIASVKNTFSVEVNTNFTKSSTFSETKKITHEIHHEIPPLSRMSFKLEYRTKTLKKLPFTARMAYFLDNRESFYTDIEGYYDGVDTTNLIETTKKIGVYKVRDNDQLEYIPFV